MVRMRPACKHSARCYVDGMNATTAVDAPSPHAFDRTKQNLSMFAMGVIVLVLWLLFRTILKSKRDATKTQPPAP